MRRMPHGVTMPVPVIQVITHLPLGGAQRVVLSLAERLDRRRFDVHLAAGPRGDWLDRAKNIPGCEFHPIPHLLRELKPASDAMALSELTALFFSLRKRHPQGLVVVHTHAPKAGLLGRMAARLAGCRVVHTLHGLPFYQGQPLLRRVAYQQFERLGYRRRDELVSVSQTNLDRLLALGWTDRDHIRVIPPCVDLERLAPRRAPRTHLARRGVQEHHRVIGMVASLKAPKDPKSFLSAAATLTREDAGLRFVLAGDGDMRPELERQAEEMGLGGRLLFLGWFDPIEELYPELDILVLPTFSEGLPLVLVEARACGVPVVSTPVGGIPELIQHDRNGLLVPPGDAGALTHALSRLLNDPVLYARIRQNGFDGLVTFSPNRMTEAHEALYSSMLGF